MDNVVDTSVDQCARNVSVGFDVPSTIVADRYSTNNLEQRDATVVISIRHKRVFKPFSVQSFFILK